MAKIVLGIGSSHSPILLMEPPAWLKRGETDDQNRHALYDNTGAHVTYAELAERAPATILDEIRPEVLDRRHRANEAAIANIAKVLGDVDPDVVIIIGDDHREVFKDDNMPALSVYWGNTLPYLPQGIMEWRYADDLKSEKWYPQIPRDYPVASELAERLIVDLCELGYDPAHSKYYREGQGMSHSFGYIYHRIMGDRQWPVIPVSINTYYPPNQISPLRAFSIGAAIRQAVEAWPDDIRVAVMATGGLSHFVIDEAFDRAFIETLRRGGPEGHAALPRNKLQSGNSELRCWSLLAGAVDGMAFDLIDYIPCYRSPGGTGCGMAFATWQ